MIFNLQMHASKHGESTHHVVFRLPAGSLSASISQVMRKTDGIKGLYFQTEYTSSATKDVFVGSNGLLFEEQLDGVLCQLHYILEVPHLHLPRSTLNKKFETRMYAALVAHVLRGFANYGIAPVKNDSEVFQAFSSLQECF